MEKLFLIPVMILAAFFLSGCSVAITERGHNADWNEGYEAALNDSESQYSECVDSLRGEISDLKRVIVSTDIALSQATEPGFGYFPPYDDLLDAFESAKNSQANYSSGIIHTSCP